MLAERCSGSVWSSMAGSEMADWLLSFAAGDVGVAVEAPRGPVVESLMEHGIAVHSLNPKQRDRFRNRLSPAGVIIGS